MLSVLLGRGANVQLEIPIEAAQRGIAAIVRTFNNGLARVAQKVAGAVDPAAVDHGDKGHSGGFAEIARQVGRMISRGEAELLKRAAFIIILFNEIKNSAKQTALHRFALDVCRALIQRRTHRIQNRLGSDHGGAWLKRQKLREQILGNNDLVILRDLRRVPWIIRADPVR